MRKRKPLPRPVAAPEVLFDDRAVQSLWREARCPGVVNATKLREGLVRAGQAYNDALGKQPNSLRLQIQTLCAAAADRRYEAVAAAIGRLSPAARGLLEERAQHPGFAGLPDFPGLPDPPALRDPKQREAACHAVYLLCQHGSRRVIGRNRPSGRRSISLKHYLSAPAMQRHPKIRRAERIFIMRLQLAWFEATGKTPALTAAIERRGPFVRFAQSALNHLHGGVHASAVELISGIHLTRIQAASRQDDEDDDGL